MIQESYLERMTSVRGKSVLIGKVMVHTNWFPIWRSFLEYLVVFYLFWSLSFEETAYKGNRREENILCASIKCLLKHRFCFVFRKKKKYKPFIYYILTLLLWWEMKKIIFSFYKCSMFCYGKKKKQKLKRTNPIPTFLLGDNNLIKVLGCVSF